MPSSSSDKALWDLLRYATPFVVGYLLIKHGTDWSQLLVMNSDGAVPLGFLLTAITLVGLMVIMKSSKRDSGS
ncbi:MAG: hypothetical protein VX764_07370 [Planctomycetota bacterium]|nr:hypothetical protein [Planctomycetota bacterium]